MKWICKIKSLLLLQVVNSYNIPGIWSAKKSTQAKKWQGLALPVPPRPRSLTFMSIRTDQRFYSVNEALMATARKYSRQGDKTKAKEYEEPAYDFQKEDEWMAYKEIPTSSIQQATYYPRNSGSLNNAVF